MFLMNFKQLWRHSLARENKRLQEVIKARLGIMTVVLISRGMIRSHLSPLQWYNKPITELKPYVMSYFTCFLTVFAKERVTRMSLFKKYFICLPTYSCTTATHSKIQVGSVCIKYNKVQEQRTMNEGQMKSLHDWKIRKLVWFRLGYRDRL